MKLVRRMGRSSLLGLALLITLVIFARTGYLANRTPTVSRFDVGAKSFSKTTPKLLPRQQVKKDYGKLPVIFEANHGQLDSRVKFMSRGPGYNLYLTPQDAVLTLREDKAKTKVLKTQPAKLNLAEAPNLSRRRNKHSVQSEKAVIRMSLAGANPNARIVGLEQQVGKVNYFIGNDPQKWRTNIPTFKTIKYEGVYPGIDLFYYGNQQQLEYDLVIAPGASPTAIRLNFHGAQTTWIDARGDLIMRVAGGEIRHKKPIVYQETGGHRSTVDGQYVLRGKHQVGFEIADYDQRKPLTIDPVVIYSTYLGGSAEDLGYGIAVDSAGNAYVTGEAISVDFPNANSVQARNGGRADVFISKLNASGTAILYSTYLGGSGSGGDIGYSIAVDSSGSAYVTGYTRSNDFPTKNPLQPVSGGGPDAFVAKLNPTGSALVYSTYLGGSAAGLGDGDFGYGIAIDAAGNAYVTGETTSINFPTVNPLQAAKGGGRDAFVSKLNATGTALLYSTYLGGTAYEHGRINADFHSNKPGNRIAVDTSGNAYVTGYTWSTDFPTANPLQPRNRGQADAFVSKLNATGTALVYSTYLGGSGSAGDYAYGITVDAAGNAYVTGDTSSVDFPTTTNAFQPLKRNREDVFLTKLNATGTALSYSTFLGGDGGDFAYSVALDTIGNAYVVGETFSTNFPVQNPLQPNLAGANDVFVTKLSPGGAAVVYSTYLGGSNGDHGAGIAVDTANNAYVIGSTISTNFPVTNPLQFDRGNWDILIAKILDAPTFSVKEITPNKGGNTGEVSTSVFGGGFQVGTSVMLKSAHAPDIAGQNIIIVNESKMIVTFDLSGAPPGKRDVVVTLLDGSTATLPDGFTIEEGGTPQLWLNISGRTTIGRGRDVTYRITCGNSGNVDATDVIAWVAVPEQITVVADVPYMLELNAQPDVSVSRDGYVYSWVYLEKLEANGLRGFNLRLRVPEAGQIEMRGGILEGTNILRSTPSQPSQLTQFGTERSSDFPTISQVQLDSQSSFDEPQPPLEKGEIVFRLSGSGARTGHLGIHVGGGTIIDLYPKDLFTLVGEYRSNQFDEWKSEGGAVYVGSSLPPGVSADAASKAADNALQIYNDWAKHKSNVPFMAPPLPGFNDCVSFVSHAYRDAGYTPPWPDWWPPGAIYTGVSGKLWPEKTIWLLLSDFTLLLDSLHWGQILGAKAASTVIRVVASMDPNDKVGPSGHDLVRYQKGNQPYQYVIYFENVSSATAPAQEVVIVDELDPSKFDFNTFRLGPMVFGDYQVDPSPDLASFNTDLDLRPSLNVLVRITASLNESDGTITWRFTSLDPGTGELPSDPLIGFLPPNTDPPAGEGSVTFTVMPKRELATGTEIRNQASIVFDNNAAIQTQVWSNTLDNSAPSSEVHTLTPAPCSASINVQWSGTDTGSGVRDYTVYVSDNGGPFTVWLSNTTTTSGVYMGQFGHEYSFHSVARDHTGNTEGSSLNPDATLKLQAPTPPGFTNVPPTLTLNTGPDATTCGVFVSDAALGTATAQSSCPVNIVRDGVPNGNIFPVGNTTITYTATDALGNTTSAIQVVTVVDNTPPGLMVAVPPTSPTNTSCEAAIPDVVSRSTASDNCAGIVQLNQSPAAGTLVGPGTHAITVTAIDAAGNVAQAITNFVVLPAPSFAISVTPSTVKRGSKVTLNAAFRSCASSPQAVMLKLSLTTPRSSTLVLALPVTLPAEQTGSFNIPLTIPKSTPTGVYTLTLDVFVGGIKTSTTTTQLTVTS